MVAQGGLLVLKAKKVELGTKEITPQIPALLLCKMEVLAYTLPPYTPRPNNP